MGLKFLQDIANLDNIQFINSSGTNAGLINMDGNDLVISNSQGDVLLGDGSADVFIGDGVNNVDIRFEQSGFITADNSSATLTIGGTGNLVLEEPTINNPTFTSDVGIGTTSPSRQLEVSNTGDAIIRIAGDSDNDAGEVGDAVLELTTDQGGHGYSIRSENIGGGTGYFKINTFIGGTESTKLLINRDGEVGIGTTSPETLLHLTTAMSSSPTTQLYLDVDGTNTDGGGGEIIFSTSASAGSPTSYNAKITGTRVSGGTGGDSQLGFWTTLVSSSQNPQERMTITKEGNVGIGTSTPNKNFTVEWEDNNTSVDTGEGLGGGAAGSGVLLENTSATVNSYANLDFRSNNADGRIAYKYNSINDGDFHFITDNGNNPETKLFIKSSGEVGIGTTSPSGKLHVSSGGSPSIIIQDTDGTDQYATINHNNGSNQYIARSNTSNGQHIWFGQTGLSSFNERMRIDSSGNVGIGTGSPSVKLHVQSADETVARIERTSGSGYTVLDIKDGVGTTGNSILRFSDTTASNGYIDYEHADDSMRFGASASEAMRITSSNNVGVGITSPSSKLHVMHTDASVDTLRLGRTDNNNFWRVNHAGNDFRLYNDASSGSDILLGVDAGGSATANKVGIGTAVPAVELDVVGDAQLQGTAPRFVMKETGGNDDFSLKVQTDGRFSVFNNNLASEVLTIEQGGNVGIGTTSPLRKLHVSGDVEIESKIYGNSTDHTYYQIASGDYNHKFFTRTSGGASLERFRIEGGADVDSVLMLNSNVGIGTASPGEKLDVAGDIKLSGDIELGHASDTTIARASAGKVTIEGQPIQTKQMSMTHHNFFMNSTSTTTDFFIPYNNLNESSNPTNSIYYGRMVAPYDGRIVKVVLHTTAAIGTACQVLFWVATSAGVFAPSAAETVTGVDLNTANTSATATFSTTSTAEFDEGDVLGVSIIKSTTATANMQVTVVWEYTV